MYRIEKMDIADYNEIFNLWNTTEGIGLSGEDESKKSIKKFLKKNQHTCYVATYNKTEIVGTILAGNDGRRGHIYHLMVKPEHRRNGIGKKLLQKVEKSLRKEGIRKVFLVVFKDNATGNFFWADTGYDIRADLHYRDKRIMD